MDEWQPVSMVEEPTDLDEGTLDSVPTIQGPNGLKVKIHPNGKTVSPDRPTVTLGPTSRVAVVVEIVSNSY